MPRPPDEQAPSPDWAAIRHAFESGRVSIKTLLRRHHLTRSEFMAMKRRQNWQRTHYKTTSKAGYKPKPAAPAASADSPKPDQRRTDLINRLYKVLEQKILEIETIMLTPLPETDIDQNASHAEKQAKTLAVLVTLFDKISALELAGQPPARRKADQITDDADERDDENETNRIREDLARRLERLQSERQGQ